MLVSNPYLAFVVVAVLVDSHLHACFAFKTLLTSVRITAALEKWNESG